MHGLTLRRLLYSALATAIVVIPLAQAPVIAHGATVSYNVVDDTADHVTADALPTVQIDSGVVWSTAISGDVVFAGGEFSNARPAGAAAGTNLTPRANLLAFSLSTGVLNTTWAPTTNGAVRTVALSPDKQTVYIGGTFTQVDGVARTNIAAVSASTGALLPFAPTTNSAVQTIVATSSTVYFGGSFTQVSGQSRPYLAAATTSGTLTTWSPIADYTVRGLALTPDGTRIIAGGSFSQINGTSSPGLASIDATNGTLYPFAANQVVQNYGTSSAIWSLKSDGTNILATGYWYGGTGNFEGVLMADPYSGNIEWMADCHGDSYGATTLNNIVYSVSHHHDCSNISSFPQQNPWAYARADSFTYAATSSVNTNSAGGYHDFAGEPAPSHYNWFPTLQAGTYTGTSQAAWTANSSNNYLVLAGEFPRVNGTLQQGLVRFTTPANAPKKQGPQLSSAQMAPTLTVVGNAVRVSWPSSWDRDDQQLTYTLYRDDLGTNPLYTKTATSQWWNMPTQGYLDTGLQTNATYTYYVVVTDPNGNKVTSTKVSTTTGANALDASPYSKLVTSDGASHYWRFTEPTGSSDVIDWIGGDDLTAGSGVTLGQNGFMSASADTAAAFDGTDNGRAVATQQETGSNSLSIETWIRTSSTVGGKIIGFGAASGLTSNSNNYDRQIYMDDAGHIIWGTNGGSVHTLTTSATYNDGQWHQIVATLGSAGTTLYVDGLKAGADSSETTGEQYNGYWHVGGDSLSGWPSQPSSNDFTGTIDDTSIYPTALTQDQIRAHYAASGRTMNLPQRPGDTYGGLVYDDNPQFYWRLDDTSGTVAKDATQNVADGAYTGGVILADPTAVEGTSVQFNGTDAGVHTTSAITSPDTYSEEAWFNTTSTSGGKIIGFGSNATGYSGSYDRHVYMDPSGHVDFGVWTGQENVIASSGTYNDGAWHHVVATQGSDGMDLYVDGVLIGTNATTAGDDYTGYWRVGGDSSWNGNGYFNGLIDEAAVYDKVLTLDQVRSHYRAATVTHDQAPVPSFTFSCDNYGACAGSAAASSDADGTVTDYAWSVDGTQVQTDQEFAQTLTAGTHTVSLTVTDDQGVTATTSRQVTVTVQNRPPTAAFTNTCTNTACSFDGSVSSDLDGTVTKWAWDFGDGSTGTGATPTHTYAAAGTYTVTLTATDDAGATNTATKTITVTAAVPPTAAFTATASGLTASVDATASKDADGTIASYAWDFGDGARGTGATATHTYTSAGTYTITLTVTDGSGLIDTVTHDVTVTAPNQAPTASFTATPTDLSVAVDGTASTDADGSVTTWAWDFGDGSTDTGSTSSHTYAKAGTYTITLVVTDDQGATDTMTKQVTVKAPNQAPSASFTSSTANLVASFDASASADTDGTIASYAWDFGDGSTGTGVTASHTYATAGTYTVLLTVTDNDGATNTITKTVTVAAAANKAPTAAFTASATNLALAVDGSGSSDSDGTVASYAWDFGDGGTATGATASHTYAAAGTYTVKLTVTDNAGATNTTSKSVTVTVAATTTTVAQDTFARTASTWGTATTGGTYTYSGSGFSTNGTAGLISLAKAGSSPTAWLSPTATNYTFTGTFSLNKLDNGSGTYFELLTRHTSSGDYRFKVRVNSSGAVLVVISKVLNGTETNLASKTLTGVTYTAGSTLHVVASITGTTKVSLSSTVWLDGTTQPTTASVTASDSSNTLTSGTLGIQGYLSGSATNAPIVLSVGPYTVTTP